MSNEHNNAGPYRVDPGSESGHCCFEATVLNKHGENIAECLLKADAERICKALNTPPAAAPAPAVSQDSDPTSKEQYRRMFVAACEALGAISDALGCDPEDGGAEPILGALEELQISLGLSNGILGCLSAAPALQEGEPVMWVMRAHETGQLEPARPHQKAKHPKIWSDAFPLYAAAPAAPSQEPSFCDYCGGNDEDPQDHCMDCERPSQPVTLTDDEARAIYARTMLSLLDETEGVIGGPDVVALEMPTRFASAIIAALREKGALR